MIFQLKLVVSYKRKFHISLKMEDKISKREGQTLEERKGQLSREFEHVFSHIITYTYDHKNVFFIISWMHLRLSCLNRLNYTKYVDIKSENMGPRRNPFFYNKI